MGDILLAVVLRAEHGVQGHYVVLVEVVAELRVRQLWVHSEGQHPDGFARYDEQIVAELRYLA
jgi:hypothetical protein